MSSTRLQEAAGSRRSVFSLIESYNGPTAYASGGVLVTSSVFQQIDRAQVLGPTTSGFIAQVVTGSITGNQMRVQVFVPAQVTGGGTGEVASGTNLSAHGFYIYEEGAQPSSLA